MLELIFCKKKSIILKLIFMVENCFRLIQFFSKNFLLIPQHYRFIITKDINYDLKEQTPFLLVCFDHLTNPPLKNRLLSCWLMIMT